jgi:hypothetical protein
MEERKMLMKATEISLDISRYGMPARNEKPGEQDIVVCSNTSRNSVMCR